MFFSDSNKDPDYTEKDVGQLYSEIEKDVNETIGEDLSDCYKDFKKDNKGRNKSEEYYKAEFAKEILTNFYTSMDTVFRNDFGTGSDTAKGLLGLFFGKNEES